VVVPGESELSRPFEFCVDELYAGDEGGDVPGGGSVGAPDAGVGGGGGGFGGEGGSGAEGGFAGDGGASGEADAGGVGPVEGGLGYLEQGAWHGYLYAGVDAMSSVVRDGMCISGTVAVDPLSESFALWGWNVSQELESEAGSWTPDTTDLFYDLSAEGGASLRSNIYDELGSTYCYILPDESGNATLTDFNTQCWDGEGEYYDGAVPLVGVQVLVPGNDQDPQPFSVCVQEILPAP